MKKGIVITIFLCIIVVCVYLLMRSLDMDNSDVTDNSKSKEVVVTAEPDNNSDNDNDSDDDNNNNNNTKTDDNTDKPDNIEEKEKELNLYTIDYDNMECIPNSVVVPGTFVVNAENIVNKVIEDFLETPVVIKVEEEGDGIIVYFDNEKAPVVNVSADMETAMLDSIAYSLIDNLSSCKVVYYRTNEGNYHSQNISLEYDEPYLSYELSE